MAIKLSITGEITGISPEIKIGKEQNMIKRIVGIRDNDPNEQFPNSLSVDFLQDKAEFLASYQVGDIVEVQLNTSYSRFPSKQDPNVDSRYNSIRGRKISLIQKGGTQTTNDPEKKAIDNDLPF